MKLYKQKYLIAVYNKDDFLVDVVDTVKELKFLNHRSVHTILSKKRKSLHAKYKYFLIDVYEPHNDIFQEEDELFKKFIKKSNLYIKERNEIIAQKLGISTRTFYRWKQIGKIKIDGGGEKIVINRTAKNYSRKHLDCEYSFKGSKVIS